jgi:hypothetical protein
MIYYRKAFSSPFYVANAEINMTVGIIVVSIQETLNSID